MLRVNIVGIGPGNPKLLTGAALEAINQSTILIGDKRMLANFASKKRFYDTIKTAEICKICANANPEKDIVSILDNTVNQVWPSRVTNDIVVNQEELMLNPLCKSGDLCQHSRQTLFSVVVDAGIHLAEPVSNSFCRRIEHAQRRI